MTETFYCIYTRSLFSFKREETKTMKASMRGGACRKTIKVGGLFSGRFFVGVDGGYSIYNIGFSKSIVQFG